MNIFFSLLALTFAATMSKTFAGGLAEADATPGTAVVAAEDEAAWWQSLSAEQQSKLSSLFDPEWYDQQTVETKIAYCYVAQSLYDFLSTPGLDSRDDDAYVGFAPLLLRASFHAAGTFHAPSGTGGTNGGSIFSPGELQDDGNACIEPAVEEMQKLFQGSPRVTLADAMVIGGSVALDTMDFPRMDLLRIYGGRTMVDGLAWRDRLPNPDFNPTELFKRAYNLTPSEFTGGGHNFGSAHGVCSGYVGDWTKNPTSWKSVDDPNGSEFFVDLLKEDWRWYEVCTYHNATSVFTTIPNPFAADAQEEGEEEEAEQELSACAVEQSAVPFICEAQAMRGCDFPDGAYPPLDPAILACQFRLKSDFFLKEDPILRPLSVSFADDDDLLAEQFAIAYHKLTHAGLFRCGLSGFECDEGSVCKHVHDETDDHHYLTSYCEVVGSTEDTARLDNDDDDDDDDDFALGTAGSIAAVVAIVVLALAILILLVLLAKRPSPGTTSNSSSSDVEKSAANDSTEESDN